MGAEPARIVAAPRSALGGAAPKREAAASQPLPAPPARDREHSPREGGFRDRERGPRRDEGPRRDDRAGGDRPHRDDRGPREGGFRDRGPRPERTDRPARPAEGRPAEGHPDRGPRPERGPRDERGRGRDDRRTAAAVSSSEADEVRAARSLAREREELQAAEASPAALDSGKAILGKLMDLMGFAVEVQVETGETNRLNVVGRDEEEHDALGAIIGRKGERLSALQHVVNLMLSREMGEWTRILVDVEG